MATKPAGPRKRAVYGTRTEAARDGGPWIVHRATGVGIILFLFAHVVDTAVIGWGPEAYEKVLSVYHNPFVLALELVLVGMVLFHALNGMRIMIVDFWPRAAEYHVRMFYATAAVFVLAMIRCTWIVGRSMPSDRMALDTRDPSAPMVKASRGLGQGTGPAGTGPAAASSCGPGSSCGSTGSSCCSWRWGMS